jgi:hypothetical protein
MPIKKSLKDPVKKRKDANEKKKNLGGSMLI